MPMGTFHLFFPLASWLHVTPWAALEPSEDHTLFIQLVHSDQQFSVSMEDSFSAANPFTIYIPGVNYKPNIVLTAVFSLFSNPNEMHGC